MPTVREAIEESYEGEPSWKGKNPDQYAQVVTYADFLTDAGIEMRKKVDDIGFMGSCKNSDVFGVNVICDNEHLMYAYLHNGVVHATLNNEQEDNEFWNLCKFFWQWWLDHGGRQKS